jgi:hypothetical protein
VPEEAASTGRDDSAKRREKRKEDWLQEALNHTERILEHIQATRIIATKEIGLMYPEEIDKTILTALTPEYTPSKLRRVDSLQYDELKECFAKVQEAFMAVRIAQMDLDHDGVEPYSVEYEPTYVVQWYTTQLQNFESVARRILAGN